MRAGGFLPGTTPDDSVSTGLSDSASSRTDDTLPPASEGDFAPSSNGSSSFGSFEPPQTADSLRPRISADASPAERAHELSLSLEASPSGSDAANAVVSTVSGSISSSSIRSGAPMLWEASPASAPAGDRDDGSLEVAAPLSERVAAADGVLYRSGSSSSSDIAGSGISSGESMHSARSRRSGHSGGSAGSPGLPSPAKVAPAEAAAAVAAGATAAPEAFISATGTPSLSINEVDTDLRGDNGCPRIPAVAEVGEDPGLPQSSFSAAPTAPAGGSRPNQESAETLCAAEDSVEDVTKSRATACKGDVALGPDALSESAAATALREASLGEHSAQWQSRAKHVFVLTAAGESHNPWNQTFYKP